MGGRVRVRLSYAKSKLFEVDIQYITCVPVIFHILSSNSLSLPPPPPPPASHLVLKISHIHVSGKKSLTLDDATFSGGSGSLSGASGSLSGGRGGAGVKFSPLSVKQNAYDYYTTSTHPTF